MSKKKLYDDDDGRSIADMSGVEQPNLFGFRSPNEPSKKDRANPADSAEEPKQERPWESEPQMPKEDRRAYMLAAVLTALGIGAVFLVGLGLVIWIMTLLWL